MPYRGKNNIPGSLISYSEHDVLLMSRRMEAFSLSDSGDVLKGLSSFNLVRLVVTIFVFEVLLHNDIRTVVEKDRCD